MMSMKQMDKYELKTGEGLKDTVAYKVFEKVHSRGNSSQGFYSAFNDYKNFIEEYLKTISSSSPIPTSYMAKTGTCA